MFQLQFPHFSACFLLTWHHQILKFWSRCTLILSLGQDVKSGRQGKSASHHEFFCIFFRTACWSSLCQLDAGGKPSTWLPPGRLVELMLLRLFLLLLLASCFLLSCSLALLLSFSLALLLSCSLASCFLLLASCVLLLASC